MYRLLIRHKGSEIWGVLSEQPETTTLRRIADYEMYPTDDWKIVNLDTGRIVESNQRTTH